MVYDVQREVYGTKSPRILRASFRSVNRAARLVESDDQALTAAIRAEGEEL
jgi:hypothetical protein